MSKSQTYTSFEALVDAVAISMPDEYPSGVAAVFAQGLIDDGKVVIQSLKSEDEMADLIDMLRDKPADFDVRTAQQMTFVGDKSTIESSSLVLYDDGSYFEVYAGNDIKKLVEERKMEGVIVPIAKVKDMTVLLLDSYAVLMNPNSTLEEKLRVSQRINDLLETMRLL
jgi:hypothetical protein